MSDSTTAHSTTPAAAAAPVAAPAPAADAAAAPTATSTSTSEHPIEQAIQATPQELGHKVRILCSPTPTSSRVESSRVETRRGDEAMRCGAMRVLDTPRWSRRIGRV